MSLSTYAAHARAMSTAEHKPDCPHITAREPYWPSWSLAADGMSMSWNGPKPPWSPPPCDGCVSDDERALWSQLADEAEAHLAAKREETLL